MTGKELEKELEMYIPETNIHRRSQLQLFVGYSYDDVIAECRRLESAEETVKKELEQAKAAHTVQEERKQRFYLATYKQLPIRYL